MTRKGTAKTNEHETLLKRLNELRKLEADGLIARACANGLKGQDIADIAKGVRAPSHGEAKLISDTLRAQFSI